MRESALTHTHTRPHTFCARNSHTLTHAHTRSAPATFLRRTLVSLSLSLLSLSLSLSPHTHTLHSCAELYTLNDIKPANFLAFETQRKHVSVRAFARLCVCVLHIYTRLCLCPEGHIYSSMRTDSSMRTHIYADRRPYTIVRTIRVQTQYGFKKKKGGQFLA